jgi:hypothetical protein
MRDHRHFVKITSQWASSLVVLAFLLVTVFTALHPDKRPDRTAGWNWKTAGADWAPRMMASDQQELHRVIQQFLETNGSVQIVNKVMLDGYNLTTVAQGVFDANCTEQTRALISTMPFGTFDLRWQESLPWQRVTISTDGDSEPHSSVLTISPWLEPAMRLAPAAGYCHALRMIPHFIYQDAAGDYRYTTRFFSPPGNFDYRLHNSFGQADPAWSFRDERVVRVTSDSERLVVEVRNPNSIVTERIILTADGQGQRQ